MFKDYYKILGISRHASAQEIKAAYRRMSKKWHPDRNPGKDVVGIMQDINEAYALLKDDESRRKYEAEYDLFCETISAASSAQQNEETPYAYKYYEVHDESLKEDIATARQYAKDLVNEFFHSLKEASSNAAKGAMEGALLYTMGAIVAAVIFALIRKCH